MHPSGAKGWCPPEQVGTLAPFSLQQPGGCSAAPSPLLPVQAALGWRGQRRSPSPRITVGTGGLPLGRDPLRASWHRQHQHQPSQPPPACLPLSRLQLFRAAEELPPSRLGQSGNCSSLSAQIFITFIIIIIFIISH